MNQRLIVKGIVFKDDKLLFVQRKKDGHELDGKWKLPGGKVELGERLEDAVVRETQEEAGIVSEFNKILIDKYVNLSTGGLQGNHLILIPILCNYVSTVLEHKSDDNVHQIKWFKLNELPKSEVLEGTLKMISGLY